MTTDAGKPEIHFYHLTSTPLERALPKLLEKALQGGYRSVVLMDSEEKTEWMNNLLWTYDPDSFLPHGSVKDGNADMQPVYITSTFENPNTANLLVITNNSEYPPGHAFKRVIDIFDGTDEAATAQARERWKQYKSSGYLMEYRKQGENGAWQTQK